MKKIIIIESVAIVLLLVCISFYVKATPRPVQAKLLTIKQIQQRIGAEVDGIWGQETQKKYELALNQQVCDELVSMMPKEGE